jgi:hypothetical protein
MLSADARGIAIRQIPFAMANSLRGNHILRDFVILGPIVAVPIPTRNILTTRALALPRVPRKAPAMATIRIEIPKAHREPILSVIPPPMGEKTIEGSMRIPIISPIWALVRGISLPISVNKGGTH